MNATTEVSGLGFPESLRWHQGSLWFSDMFRGKVMRWSMDEGLETIIDGQSGAPSMPGGLGWLKTGELIVVDCNERKLIKRSASGEVSIYADLSKLTNFLLNDMYVDRFGVAWVGGHGFDPESNVRTASPIYKVKSGTDIQPTNAKFIFPNGCDQYQDKFAVAETFADQISYINLDGDLIKKFDLPEGCGPDGISFDAQGRLFIASAFAGTLDFINEKDELINLFRFESATKVDGSEPSRGVYDCAANSELGIIAFASASIDEKYAMEHDTGAIFFMKLP